MIGSFRSCGERPVKAYRFAATVAFLPSRRVTRQGWVAT